MKELNRSIHKIKRMKKYPNKSLQHILKKLKLEYDFVGNPCHGTIKVVKNGKYGFVDEKGKVLIPLIYDWSSSFTKIKLYGTEYVGAYVTLGSQQTIITRNNRKVICSIKNGILYYIINGKLWVNSEQGYNLISRQGKKLLATDYDLVVNDRFRQPKNMFIVNKDGSYGVIHVSYNNKERTVVPLIFEHMNFWWAPIMGTFLECGQNGKKGLYSLKGEVLVPCKYSRLECNIHFRKGFIVAYNNKRVELYDGKRPLAICSDPYHVDTRYTFYYRNECYFSAFTTAEELLLDKDARVLVRLNKEKHISYFHFLMDQQRGSFRFKSLRELIDYCKADPQKRIGRKDLVAYAYFFIEEELHRYAMLYNLKYVCFVLCDGLKTRYKYWGCCDPVKREITLNIELIFTSEDFVRQVILHELCHLIHPDHGKRFYKLLNELYGANVRKEPDFYLSNLWLVTVDTIAVVREHMKKLYDLAERGVLQRMPENKFVPEVSTIQSFRECRPIDEAIAALKVEKKKPTNV